MGNAKTSTVGMTTSNDLPNDDNDLLETSSAIGKRRKAREIALQALYAAEISGDSLDTVIRNVFTYHDESAEVKEFARSMIEKCYQYRDELDEYIRRRTKNWDFNRIAIIDRLVMRMAICEFLYFFDIPPKVSIDEAIELTKLYSTDQSGRFVNGILDAVLLELKNKNQLVKAGRGLQESSRKKRDEK